MQFLSIWTKILIIGGFVFFGVWAIVCDLWTERDPKKLKNIMAGVMVSWIYAFRAFLLATVIFVAIYIIVTYII